MVIERSSLRFRRSQLPFALRQRVLKTFDL